MNKEPLKLSEYIVHNAYNTDSVNGYLILFGAMRWGYLFPLNIDKDILARAWRYSIKSYRDRNDIYLYKDGKLIRILSNGQNRILDKGIDYPCIYEKR